jgi:thioredoxin reductase (NADPH)
MKALMPEIDVSACNACGDCVAKCPTGAVGMVAGKAALVKPEECRYCTDCEAICPVRAIRCPFVIVLVSQEAGPKVQKR